MTWKPLVVVALVLVVLIAHVDAAVTIRFTADASSRLTADARQTIERIAVATEAEVRRHLPELSRDLVLSVEVGSNVIPQPANSGLP